ncbi:hypothetical protein [Streptomyces microflavus]|uniref:hypothetical protein n=1 Tax=Streptomyces microflavus TaxID=1919 RepID=UPI0035D70F8D
MVSGLVSSRARTLDVREGSIPGPDKVIDGVPHWKRSTVLAADDLLDRDEARLELRNPITLANWGFYCRIKQRSPGTACARHNPVHEDDGDGCRGIGQDEL